MPTDPTATDSDSGSYFPTRPPTHGTCQVCGRSFRLRSDGRVRSHWKRDGSGKGLPFSDPCDGAGQPAMPTAPEESA